MQLGALERVGARKGRFGPARVPVMAVGHDQGVVLAYLALAVAALDRHLPHAVRAARGMLHARLKGDVLAQPEVVDVVVEVLLDVRVMGKVRIGAGHRIVRVGHPLARDVDEQVPVGSRHPVAVAKHPVAADLV